MNQEPYNEVAATALHRRLMEPGEFTPYTLFEDGRRVYSACPNLLGPDEELVAAWDAIRNVKQPNNLSGLRFYVKRLEDLGLDADATMTDLYRFFGHEGARFLHINLVSFTTEKRSRNHDNVYT